MNMHDLDENVAKMLNELPDTPLDELVGSSDEPDINLEENVDNNVEDAIIEDKDVSSEESDAVSIDASDTVVPPTPTVMSMEDYLASLPDDTARADCKYAVKRGWKLEEFLNGNGYSHVVFNSREPFIKKLKEQQTQINKLEKLLEGSVNNSKRDLIYNKNQALDMVKAANKELADADESQDYEQVKLAHSKLVHAETVIKEIDERLKNFEQEDLSSKEPEIDPKMLADYKAASDAFIYRNKEWIYSNSDKYDREKLKKAQDLEKEMLLKYKGMDPVHFYNMLEIELNKGNSMSNTRVSDNVVRKNPVVASKAANKSVAHKPKVITEAENTIREALKLMHKEAPSKASKLMTMKEFDKMRGIK